MKYTKQQIAQAIIKSLVSKGINAYTNRRGEVEIAIHYALGGDEFITYAIIDTQELDYQIEEIYQSEEVK